MEVKKCHYLNPVCNRNTVLFMLASDEEGRKAEQGCWFHIFFMKLLLPAK